MTSGSVARYRLALTLVGFTWALLIVGANVTSTGSGLAVPDWPLAFGQWLPEMVGKVLNEHGHRLFAMAVGVLTLALAIWVGIADPRPAARWLAIAALGAVIAQGLLGRATVLMGIEKGRLPAEVSIAHAGLAEAFFCITVALARVLRPGHAPAPTGAGRSPLYSWCAIATATVYVQILLGALIRHTGSGLPWHLAGVVAVFLVVYCAGQRILETGDDPERLRRPALFAMALVLAQLALGMGAAVWLGTFDAHKGAREPLQIWVRNLHLGTGALLLATLFLMTLRAWRLPPTTDAVRT